MALQKEMLDLIPAYIKWVFSKREIYSKILLGQSFEDILKKAKEVEDKSNNNISDNKKDNN